MDGNSGDDESGDLAWAEGTVKQTVRDVDETHGVITGIIILLLLLP